MFNNYVNIYDIFRLTEKIRQGDLFKILSRFIPQKDSLKIAKAWQHNDNPPKNWWDIPQVQKRWSFLVTGEESISIHDYTAKKYLTELKDLSAFSLCSGTGHNEINWTKTGCFKSIKGFDLALTRVKAANDFSRRENLNSILSFEVKDAVNLNLEKELFDVIIADGALHHLTPLDEIIKKLKYALKKNGLFILKDFVGPSRFQWTDKQILAVNFLLNKLPEKYKRRWKSDSIKNKHYKPSKLSMILSDPSEAVESSAILNVLKKHFSLLELKPMGGTILQLLFNDIAHNFLNEDAETQKWINYCFNYEDSLLKSNEISSDFVYAIYKN